MKIIYIRIMPIPDHCNEIFDYVLIRLTVIKSPFELAVGEPQKVDSWLYSMSSKFQFYSVNLLSLPPLNLMEPVRRGGVSGG
jgi:hypothetical protein